MAKRQVVVSIDENLLLELDRWVKLGAYDNRSTAVEDALQEKLNRLSHERLARECAKLDPQFEKALAEEGMHLELDQHL